MKAGSAYLNQEPRSLAEVLDAMDAPAIEAERHQRRAVSRLQLMLFNKRRAHDEARQCGRPADTIRTLGFDAQALEVALRALDAPILDQEDLARLLANGRE